MIQFYLIWVFFQSMPYPLSMVVIHLTLKFLLASLFRTVYSKLCAARCESRRIATANRRNEDPDPDRIVLNWGPYVKRVALVSMASAMDIGLSQWSLKFITVALYTMAKSTCILFVLFLGLIFKLEKKVSVILMFRIFEYQFLTELIAIPKITLFLTAGSNKFICCIHFIATP